MKKQNKKTNNKNIMKTIKMLTIILAIVLISMIGFLGIYKQNRNQVANTVKDYTYSMAINGARTIKLQLDTSSTEVIKDAEGKIIDKATDEEIQKNGYVKEQVPNNAQENKTVENYKKSKKIIEERLNFLGVQEYNISLDNTTAEILISIPEDVRTDTVISNLVSVGKYEIIDTDTKELLIDNSHIKSSDVLYNTTEKGTSVYLEIAFNKQGKKKLEEISKTYVVTEKSEEKDENVVAENEISEETTESTENVEKKITMKIDGQEIMTTSFDTPITNGKIQLSVGSATTNTSTLQDYITQAQSVAIALDNGNMPLKYNITKNEYILSDITKQDLINVEIAIAASALVGIIILIARYKLNGLIAGFAYIGLAAIYVLLIRYANVIISIESIFAIEIVLVLNYIFTYMLLKNVENLDKNKGLVNKAILETYIRFFNRLIPICIMTITFCFTNWIPVSSFGMTLFWGIVVIAIYNVTITRKLFGIKLEDK